MKERLNRIYATLFLFFMKESLIDIIDEKIEIIKENRFKYSTIKESSSLITFIDNFIDVSYYVPNSLVNKINELKSYLK